MRNRNDRVSDSNELVNGIGLEDDESVILLVENGVVQKRVDKKLKADSLLGRRVLISSMSATSEVREIAFTVGEAVTFVGPAEPGIPDSGIELFSTRKGAASVIALEFIIGEEYVTCEVDSRIFDKTEAILAIRILTDGVFL